MQENASLRYFRNMCKFWYCLSSPNWWFEDLQYPKLFKLFIEIVCASSNFIIIIFIFIEWTALYTQKDLNAKQISDLVLFSVSHPMMHFNSMKFYYRRKEIRNMMYNLVVRFKMMYNDEEVEKMMIKKSKIYSTVFSVFVTSALVFYAMDAITQVLMNDGTFTTVITGWPDVKDKSTAAEITRIIFYFIWWIFLIRLTAVYCMVISSTICLNHQYKNLSSYFYSLNDIFVKNDSQEEKERKYEKALKAGLKTHSEMLIYTQHHEDICHTVFGVQILLNLSVLVLLMSQMLNSDRTLGNTLSVLFTASAIIVSTGCMMWNCGDITVEASELSTALFLSGWHNCNKEAFMRIKPLIVIGMCISQKPVVLTTLGIVKISYDSYVTIVKTSYSIFSVIY